MNKIGQKYEQLKYKTEPWSVLPSWIGSVCVTTTPESCISFLPFWVTWMISLCLGELRSTFFISRMWEDKHPAGCGQNGEHLKVIKVIIYHRLTECFGMEVALKHLLSSPLWLQGYLLLDQVAKSLEQLQRWGFSEQLVPVPCHPHNEEFLPYS